MTRFAHAVPQKRRERFFDRSTCKLAPFIGMAEVLFAALFAWMLLGQLPSATQFLGGALIFAGVTLVRVDES